MIGRPMGTRLSRQPLPHLYPLICAITMTFFQGTHGASRLTVHSRTKRHGWGKPLAR